MGNSQYSQASRSVRSTIYKSQNLAQTFSNTTTAEHMRAESIDMREARDSDAHPCSVPVMICLDVTGSMGSVPEHLVKEGLPKMIAKLMNEKLNDAAIMMVAVGDHRSDRCPIQVGQFESGDEELDNDLTNLYLEGNGGGNGGESYPLAWFVASQKTKTDHWDKRKKKGILITVGDERFHTSYSTKDLKDLMGPGEYHDMTAHEMLKDAQERWHIFHIHVNGTPVPDQEGREEQWSLTLGNNYLIAEDFKSVPDVLAKTIARVALNDNDSQHEMTSTFTEPATQAPNSGPIL